LLNIQHLGPFISTLPGDKISQELVAYFTSTACAGVITTAGTTTTSSNANTSATSTINGAAAANNSSSNIASSNSSSNGGTAVTSGATTTAANTGGIAAVSSSSGIVMPSTLTIGGGDPQSDDELRLYCAFRYVGKFAQISRYQCAKDPFEQCTLSSHVQTGYCAAAVDHIKCDCGINNVWLYRLTLPQLCIAVHSSPTALYYAYTCVFATLLLNFTQFSSSSAYTWT
jgi:hypothetical protein